MRITVKLPNGEKVKRKGNMEWVGNFLMMWVRHNGKAYLVNEGDEYLRGYKKVFELGKEIER